MAALIIRSRVDSREIELGEHTWIGRHEKNTITLADPMISSEHCLIYRDSRRGYVVKDLKSRNGTLVNGERVQAEAVLRDGNELRLGSTSCVFRSAESAAGSMVEVRGETSQTHIHTSISPLQEKQFLPEKKIRSNTSLRADYEKLRVTHELQRDIGLHDNLDVILNRILDRTFEFLHYDRGVILVADTSGRLQPRAYRTRKGEGKFIISSTIINNVVSEKKGIISTDASVDDRFKASHSLIIHGVRSTMAAPILDGDELLGAMIVDSSASANAFTEKDLQLITSIAGQTAQMLRNSILHQELRLSFDSSIRTLAAMVDARHPLTAGHSERVTEYALLIGKVMGLPREDLEVLRFGALLHDIGKIGITDHVLLKNGPFVDTEREEMNMHPVTTRVILEKFHFPQALQEVPVVAASHHEKVNGEGYPEGLKGEEIPRLSKILAVADVFDALTSRRDYPKYTTDEALDNEPLPLDKAVGIIRDEAGRSFDPAVVEAFVECLAHALVRYRGSHFAPEYVDETIKKLAPGWLPETPV